MKEKIKSIKCKVCGSSEVYFNVQNDPNLNPVFVDFNAVKRDYNFKPIGKLKNLKDYNLTYCSCFGECDDEIFSSEVEVTLSDGSKIIDAEKIWDYIKNT